MTASLSTAPTLQSSDVFADDWDFLFGVVIDKLRQVAAEPGPGPVAPLLHDASSRLRAGVLECVTALDQLQQMIRHSMRPPLET